MNINGALEFFKKLRDFSIATSFDVIVVDRDGRIVPDLSSFSYFCQIVRSKPALKALCQDCHAFGGSDTTKPRCNNYCHMGLINVSVPIIQNNQLVGSVSIGQVERIDSTENQLTQIYPVITPSELSPELQLVKRTVKTASKPQLEAAASLLKTLIDHHFNSDLHGQIEFRLPTAKIETHQENHSKKEEICKAISYINKNYARDLTIKEVADHVYLSPFHFSRVFKNEIHVNFNTYLNQQRIKQAKNLLTQSSLSVNAISKEIGFSQTSYFCKIFRSFVGTTPAKYRKKIIS